MVVFLRILLCSDLLQHRSVIIMVGLVDIVF